MTMDLFAPKRVASTLHHGDCLDVLRTLPEASVDSVVTDPPAGIAFMGKAWDEDKGGRRQWIAWLAEVMGECLRVLKPGGHALVWALPRTSHWTATALEDAGFEVRDCLVHVFGSGFPKSMDVSKAMDKAGGASPEQTARWLQSERTRMGLSREQVAERIGCTEASVRDWEEGRSRAKGAPLEFMIPSEAYRSKLEQLFAYPADDRVIVGAGADRREDNTVYGVGHSGTLRRGGNTDLAKQWQGWGTALKPASEHWWLVRKPLIGTVAANVERYGTGALNIDATRVELSDTLVRPFVQKHDNTVFGHGLGAGTQTEPAGRWPSNLLLSHSESCEDGACADGCAVAEMDRQSGTTRSRVGKPRGSATSGDGWGMTATGAEYANSGGASRFFPVFRYQAKPSRAEREAGLREAGLREAVVRTGMGGDMPTDDQGKQRDRFSKVAANTHPTVKSIGLMDWLIRLVTPLGGVVLDPFLGSGTTGVAAAKGGFGFIGIEREDEYLAIARARIEAA